MEIEFIYKGHLVNRHIKTGECKVIVADTIKRFKNMTETKNWIDNYFKD